jgi:hypothetical protein
MERFMETEILNHRNGFPFWKHIMAGAARGENLGPGIIGLSTMQAWEFWANMRNSYLSMEVYSWKKIIELNGGFHKWEKPNSWLVYNGKKDVLMDEKWGYPGTSFSGESM